jgi:cell wall-associated NlpC family hydrolase
MLKKRFVVIIVATLCFFTFAASALASTATVERAVNFRSAPSTDSKVYQTLKKGTRIEVLQDVNKYWVKASVNGKIGYVSKNYISDFAPPSSSSNGSNASQTGQKAAKAEKIIQHAKDLIGVTKYKYGVNQPPTLMDCSAFVKYVFGKEGISLKWGTKYLKDAGTYVARSDLQPGDLVLLRVGSSSSIGHVGIYIGDGKMIHNSSSNNVSISSITTGYWASRYVTARRVI